MCVAKAQGESILKPPCCVRQRRGSSEITKGRASLDESGMNGCHQVRGFGANHIKRWWADKGRGGARYSGQEYLMQSKLAVTY